jgi:hypothetical protein
VESGRSLQSEKIGSLQSEQLSEAPAQQQAASRPLRASSRKAQKSGTRIKRPKLKLGQLSSKRSSVRSKLAQQAISSGRRF